MKQCLKCYKTYADDSLNFCLEDGELLVSGIVHEPAPGVFSEEPPATVMMDDPRRTNPTNWNSAPTYGGPMQQQRGSFQQFAAPLSRSQTLAAVSLGLGVGSMTIGWCCYLGLLLSPAALITGFIALSQIKNQPDRYTGRGLAIGGIVAGIAYFVLLAIIVIIYGAASFLRNIS